MPTVTVPSVGSAASSSSQAGGAVLIPWPIARLGHEDTTVMTSSAAPLLSRLIWRLRWVGASVVIGLAIAVPLLGLWSASQGAASRSSASASGPDRSIRSTAQPELPFHFVQADQPEAIGDAIREWRRRMLPFPLGWPVASDGSGAASRVALG